MYCQCLREAGQGTAGEGSDHFGAVWRTGYGEQRMKVRGVIRSQAGRQRMGPWATGVHRRATRATQF